MTPATGVPCPSIVLDRSGWCPPPPPAPPAPPPPVVVAVRRGRRILVAQAASKEVGTRRDAAAERRHLGVDAGVHHGNGAILAVVGNAKGPQVVQADQGAAGRAGEVSGGFELPNPLVVRRE